MNIRALALGLAAGFAVAIAPSCGTAKCGPSNCATCCDTKGQCVKTPDNSTNSTCGRQGNACADCNAVGQVCNAGTFTCTITGTGGGSGGGSGGSGGGSATCTDGCRISTGMCIPYVAQGATNCGTAGNLCTACPSGQNCTDGVCAVPDGGGAFGRIGDPCTADTDCNNIAINSTDLGYGTKAFCKKATLPGGEPYPEGYCTRRCGWAAGQCGMNGAVNNICMYGLGVIGEAENFCLKGCGTAETACTRSGYACINFGTTASPFPGCWLNLADGGPGDYDAGDGHTGGFGACTDDGMCGADGGPSFCNNEFRTDGGPAGYPGGMCSADCTLAQRDGYCGDGGTCDPSYIANIGDSKGPFIIWECNEVCNPSGAVTCRTGYVCDPVGTSTTNGSCAPRCDSPGASCGTATCNATTGLCQ